MLTGGNTGGGGGGGRIAIYHRDLNHYTGEYLVHGGNGVYQYGGAGTIYIESQNLNPAYRHFITDNNQHTTSNRIYEVERLNLTGNYYTNTYYPEMFFNTHSGVNITTTARPYAYNHNSHSYYQTTWPLSYLFSDKEANVGTFYMASGTTATLTLDLPFETYVEYIYVYPYCDTDFHVWVVLLEF